MNLLLKILVTIDQFRWYPSHHHFSPPTLFTFPQAVIIEQFRNKEACTFQRITTNRKLETEAGLLVGAELCRFGRISCYWWWVVEARRVGRGSGCFGIMAHSSEMGLLCWHTCFFPLMFSKCRDGLKKMKLKSCHAGGKAPELAARRLRPCLIKGGVIVVEEPS